MWKILLLTTLIFATPGESNVPKRKVCIIGTGPSGITATKYVAQYPNEFEPVTFEKQSDVGGMWIYTLTRGIVYECCRINGPKEFQTYHDFTNFTAGNGSFVSHTLVLEYLKNYTEHFNLRKYTQFDTNVENVSLTQDDKWLLKVRNLNMNKTNKVLCDIFISGHGHHVKGDVPKIPGIESFPGRVFHSHLFRKPEAFAGQKVLILGAGLSGIDIGIEISWNASTVYLSSRHEKRLPSILPDNIVQIDEVVGANGSKLLLSDDSSVKADALMFATGYLYDLPFLDKSAGIVIEEGKYVRPLYEHFINIEHPTMAILNIPTPGFGFIFPHAQMQYFLAVLSGNLSLPSREEMLKAANLPPGVPKRKAHYMLNETFPYYDKLEQAGHGELLPRWFEPGYWAVYAVLHKDPAHYRDKNFYIYDNDHFDYY